MQESHRGSGEPSEICAWHIRQRDSEALRLIPSPPSRNSTSVPSVKPYFSLSASGITILPSLSTFLISPPKNKKCANRSQRTKNANSDSRQTNLRKVEWTYKEAGACILSNVSFLARRKRIYLSRKKIISLYNIWLVCHTYYTTFLAICKDVL